MATNAAQRTQTFPPRTHEVSMGVKISERIAEQSYPPESRFRAPVLAASVVKLGQHLIIAEGHCEAVSEKAAMGTYISSDNLATLKEALGVAVRIVGALSTAIKLADNHEARVLVEQLQHDERIIGESNQRPCIHGTDIDGFISGNFFTSNAATAPCAVCGLTVFLGMPHAVVSGSPAHASCVTEPER